MTWSVDAAIVGGGPAGALLARRLALMSWRVVLVERGERLRSKTCGQCLAPRALPLLEREGLLESVRGLALGRTQRLRVHLGRGHWMQVAWSGCDEDDGLLVPRDRFDQMLRDAAGAAGAEVLQPAAAQVQSLDGHGAALRVRAPGGRLHVRCGLLVGADGLGSAVARAAGFAGPGSAGRKYGFSVSLAGAGADAALDGGSIEMFLLRCGYIGAVKQVDGTVHLAALVHTANRGGRASPNDVLAAASLRHQSLAQLLRHTACSESLQTLAAGPMPWRPHTVAAGRVALVGDAAGYIEPFTGEGMTCAIESAALATSSIERNGGAWNARSAGLYARMWNDRIARTQTLCRWLSAGLERPMVTSVLGRVAASMPVLAGRMARRAVTA